MPKDVNTEEKYHVVVLHVYAETGDEFVTAVREAVEAGGASPDRETGMFVAYAADPNGNPVEIF